jgi:adenosylcobinamide-GDP ribazoletransferase
MQTSDKSQVAIADLRAALGLLTRLPLPYRAATARGAAAAWAYPVAGIIIGAMAGMVAALSLFLGLTPAVAAALTLAAQAMLTGAMHEDGLADSADGLWGGWDKPRRLEIMKDSHIGSYGVLALILVTLARWSALSALLATGSHFGAIIAVGAVSRAPMAILMAWLPNAKATGLSALVGRPTPKVAALAVGIAVATCLVLTGWHAFGMVAFVGFVCLGLGLTARAKIGGQTGDILGASQQLAEAASLCALAASLV